MSEMRIESLALHYVGNQANEEPFVCSLHLKAREDSYFQTRNVMELTRNSTYTCTAAAP